MQRIDCLVCGAPSTEPHYGTDVCRACAAFFRRRVLSKYTVSCGKVVQCEITKNRANLLCKACRMQKCLKVGMQIVNVQSKRDKHGNTDQVFEFYRKLPPIELKMSSTVEYDTMRLKSLHENFTKMLLNRKSEFPRRNCRIHHAYAVNLFRIDVRLTANWINATFPELSKILDSNQQKVLFRNFYRKWTVFESAFLTVLLGKPETYHLPTGEVVEEISSYYTQHILTPRNFDLDEVARIFSKYWTDFQSTLVDKVIDMNLSIHEFLIISVVCLFDVGIEGQSEESMQLCRKIRKQLFRELHTVSQHVSRTEDCCFRLSQNMLLLPAIQKGTYVFEEELQLGGLYKVLVTDTDDWYTMVNGPSFE